jgi:hypothetical protein
MCYLDCHYVEKFNKETGETRKKHDKQACHCNNNGIYINHDCKHDIHKMIISSLELDFSS